MGKSEVRLVMHMSFFATFQEIFGGLGASLGS